MVGANMLKTVNEWKKLSVIGCITLNCYLGLTASPNTHSLGNISEPYTKHNKIHSQFLSISSYWNVISEVSLCGQFLKLDVISAYFVFSILNLLYHSVYYVFLVWADCIYLRKMFAV